MCIQSGPKKISCLFRSGNLISFLTVEFLQIGP